MNSTLLCCLGGILFLLSISQAFDPKFIENDSARREFLKSFGYLTTVGAVTATNPGLCRAAAEEDIEVYFGCGCFWHVQHELVEAERRILGRNDVQLTSRAGYAGGKAGALNGKVCYHNALQVSDYGKLGHAEVVRLKIPPSTFPAFAKEYFLLFNEQGYRADQWGDKGLEYRNLVGVPGGVTSDYAKQLVQVSQENGDKLDFAKGRGDDPDARALCFVMDSNEYPFFVAEPYHQFHDGFNWGENYPGAYNDLASQLAKKNVLGESQCPRV